MKIVFLSNFLNHHQLPLCKAFLQVENVEFYFIATEATPQERLEFGYSEMNEKYDFVLRLYRGGKEKENAIRKLKETNVLISGAYHQRFLNRKELKPKLVFHYQERIFRGEKKDKEFVRTVFRAIKNHTLKQSRHTYLLCAGAYVADDFKRIGAYKGRMYKWGYFPEVIERDEADALRSKSLDSIKILWVGRFLQLKRPQQAIEVAKRLRQKGYCFELDMIGSGEIKDDIDKQIYYERLESYVHLLDTMSPDRVRDYMDRADIFLFTSNKKEGWGAVLNEAMCSRCAVVANRWIGSVPFLIQDGKNGLIYDDTTEDLIEKTESLIADRGKMIELGERAYQTVSTCWNADVATKRLVQLSQSLLADEKWDRNLKGPCEYIG